MAERIVTHTAKDQDGDILAVCNPDSDWLQRRREWAISDILADRHTYFAQGPDDKLIPIEVVFGPAGPYLRTYGDAKEANNLDSLPDIDLLPWEVAHPDSEVLAIHAALVPNGRGKVMLMGGDEHDKSQADAKDIHHTRLYDVATNTLSDVGSPQADVFCCGHAYLGNGCWLVGGGTERWNDPGEHDEHVDEHGNPRNHWSGSRECALYQPFKQEWMPASQMQTEPGQKTRGGGRWYPTLITLADGRVLAVGGHPLVDHDDPTRNDGRHGAWMPEIYDADTDSWEYVGGHWIYVDWFDVDPEVELPKGQTRPEGVTNYLYYPRLFVVPGGRVFMASPNDGNCGWYDPGTGMIDALLLDKPPHNNRPYAETSHTAVLLPLLPGDKYTPHILFMGNEGAHRISLDSTDPNNPPTWQQAGKRDYWPDDEVPLRRHGCAVLLPTGEVFFTGGINHEVPENLDADAVLEAEIYKPGIDWESNTYQFGEEEWELTPPSSVPRNYHSVALLLPNGRVLTAGSNLNGSTGGDDVKEYRIEVYSPRYDGDANRPRITSAPSSISYGEEFEIHTNDADSIERVALMRCGSVTHAWDGDQRYVALEFEEPKPDTKTLLITAPPDGGVAPPGPYMLWTVDKAGRPCQQARFVMLS